MINLLIDNGADVGLLDKLGRILLYRSAHLGYEVATKLLINRGIVVTTKDNYGRTARNLAEETGAERTIKALNGKEPEFYIYEDCVILL
jgi:ankyrin repeat protein